MHIAGMGIDGDGEHVGGSLALRSSEMEQQLANQRRER